MDKSLENLIESYKPSKMATELVKKTKILLLVGPSGAGKDSIKNQLLKSDQFYHIVSHTTRKPRINLGVEEKNGDDYFFISNAQAEKMIKNNEFIEVKMYSGNIYGTSIQQIKQAYDNNKIAITTLEVQGVNEYKKIDPAVMAYFIVPPTFDIWIDRLVRRYNGKIDEADKLKRIKTARVELNDLITTKHYIAIVNTEINHTVKKIKQMLSQQKYDKKSEDQAIESARDLTQDINNYLAKFN